MSWKSGGRLLDKIATLVSEYVIDTEVKKKIFRDVIDAFEDADYDCWYDQAGLDKELDSVLNEKFQIFSKN